MLVLDVSGSMLTKDFTIGGQEATRVDAIREVTRKFIEARPNDRIGIIAFAGRPYVVSPMTLDHDWLLQNLDRVKIGLVEDGTAIGSAMATDAKPKSVQVGDPITVTTAISGRGNFDRVNAPLLEDDSGWHKYPPSSKFKQDDEVGISGTKTFEMVVSPNENKQALPVLAFSYFDPAKEQYVTLHSEPTAITVKGSATAPAVAAQQPASSPAAAARARAPVAHSTKPQDILYQLTDPSRTVASFEPLYARRVFLLAQTLPLAALLLFAGWKVRRARLDDREARRIGALQHEA